MLKLAEQSKRSNQAESVKCFIFYLPISCLTGNHVSQFNARYIFITTYAFFLINSRNQLLLHSFIMRHPWSCSKFYQVWLLSPPFHSGLGNVHYLAYSMELRGSVCCQSEYWKHISEVPFICVLSIVHMHYRLHSLMYFCKLTLDFFLPESKFEEVGFEMLSVFTVTAGAYRMRVVCADKQLVMLLSFHFCLTVFILCEWFWQLYDLIM